PLRARPLRRRRQPGLAGRRGSRHRPGPAAAGPAQGPRRPRVPLRQRPGAGPGRRLRLGPPRCRRRYRQLRPGPPAAGLAAGPRLAPGSPAGEPGRPRLRSGARLQHPRAQRAVECGLERQLSRNPASRRSHRLAGPALGAGGVLCLESGRGILSERRMPASAQPPAASAPTLASRPLPERVRSLLGGILEYASDELGRVLVSTLNEFEQQLFKYAEQARSNMVQTRWLEAQRLVKRTRPDLVPRFL